MQTRPAALLGHYPDFFVLLVRHVHAQMVLLVQVAISNGMMSHSEG